MRLAESWNVARFVSLEPGREARIRHECISVNHPRCSEPRDAIAALLGIAGSVNVRAFRNDLGTGGPFSYGITHLEDVLTVVQQRAVEGFYTIVNETIDIHDGGVSGVALGGIVEFAADDTPRVVEHGDACALTRPIAFELLNRVYGFTPDIPDQTDQRVEFSVHPRRVGLRGGHTLLWEIDDVEPVILQPRTAWPNRYSRFLGDKLFGLLLADSLGLNVPRTTVISRRVAPFTFGSDTGSLNWWLRTCPNEQIPGRFTTTLGWTDPFQLMINEDPEGTAIASVLSQQDVNPTFSGGSRPGPTAGIDVVEGVAGHGAAFMLGTQPPVELPSEVVGAVRSLTLRIQEALGPVRLEWAHDGARVWVLQLHLAAWDVGPTSISPGVANAWLRFEPRLGLDALRQLVAIAQQTGAGVEVVGAVGTTSHVGDILRSAKVPGRIAP